MVEKQYLTKEKHDELEEELDFLVSTRRKEIAKELDTAAALGDLRENAEYQLAREDQANLEQRINQIENILLSAEVVKGGKKNEVGVGATVIVAKKGSKNKITYKIVGAEEANMAKGKISVESPLVSAMIGKKKGDKFIFEAPNGAMEYEIKKIS